jgi:hypothetical protein
MATKPAGRRAIYFGHRCCRRCSPALAGTRVPCARRPRPCCVLLLRRLCQMHPALRDPSDLGLDDSTRLVDLPLEMLTAVCLQLDLLALVRLAETCRRFRHGDGGQETVRPPTKSPVFAALSELASQLPNPRARPTGCSESWITYPARCVRQRRCRESPPIAIGADGRRSLFVDVAGRLLACGESLKRYESDLFMGVLVTPRSGSGWDPTPVAAMAGLRVRAWRPEKSTSWLSRGMAKFTPGATTGLGSWATETAWAGEEEYSTGLRRRWCRGSMACAASLRLMPTVWP